MKNIKTKETTKDIKLFDAKANIQRNIKRAIVRTKDTVENLIDDGKVSPSEYAQDRVKYAAADAAQRTFEATSDGIRVERGRSRKKKQARAALGAKRKAAKAAQATGKSIKQAARSMGRAVREAFESLVVTIGAGGVIAVAAVVIICGVGIIFGSAFGIFFSSEGGSEQTMESVVREINTEYNDQLQAIKEENTYDRVEMSGSSAVWREVLAYYAVKTSMATEAAQEVVTLNAEKIELLKEIFWEMNTISFEPRTETKIVMEETVDEDGKIIEVPVEKEITTLYITVSHLSADQMAERHGLSEEQKEMMHTLLSDEYRSMWGTVLYGIKSGETAIIEVAVSQIGNVGGEPYWSYFGFTSRIAWCACFVSWCGNECGYIENGIMPNTISCVTGMNWYKERGQWIDGNQEPLPGMIIFYDWDDPDGEFGPQDGKPDHTGIVEKVENGVIWIIEGNSGDSCRRSQHTVGEYVIIGYGCPLF